jgi:phosphatidylglycerophosphatase A
MESVTVRRWGILQRQLDRLWEWTALVLGTGLGVGYSRFMPGTVGSLWGPPLVWGLQQANLPGFLYVLVCLVIVALGIPICSRAARSFGRHDPGQVVYDEVAAFPLVYFAIEVDVATGVIGFLWFRVFDIIKPWPITKLEKLPGGLGVMIDDQMAAVYACGAVWVSIYLLGWR